jgi:hypothetical protein
VYASAHTCTGRTAVVPLKFCFPALTITAQPPAAGLASSRMVDLHNSLALHPDDMRDFQESPVALDIREGPLTRQQMQLLACVAEAARVLYWMRYKF